MNIGKGYILRCLIVAIKYVITKAVAEVNEDSVAKFLTEEVVFFLGVPEIIITDMGKPSISKVVETISSALGSRKIYLELAQPTAEAIQ